MLLVRSPAQASRAVAPGSANVPWHSTVSVPPTRLSCGAVVSTTCTRRLAVGGTETVECHGTFADPGATALDACAGDLTSSIVVTGSVDASTVGDYTLSYSVTDAHGNTATATRLVHVVDTTAPAITLVGGTETVECHGTFSDPGATATDACAGDLTSSIVVTGSVDASTVGDYTLSYSVTDAHGNTATASRLVHVVDTTAPAITLVGGTETVECHGTFTDPGATASDLCAGDQIGSAAWRGRVEISAVGDSLQRYSVTDAHGNTATASRLVHVVDTTAPAITLVGGTETG